jgi:hypothetical protein
MGLGLESTGLGYHGAMPEPTAAVFAPTSLEHTESLVRAAMHSERTPGVVLAVCHPLRMYKVPEGLFEALEERGYEVERVETLPDRSESVAQIAAALRDCAGRGKPLDLLVFSGDGSLDHHVLVAAFRAFCPELVQPLPGELSVSPPTEAERARVPDRLWEAFCAPLFDGRVSLEGLPTTDAMVQQLWVERARVQGRVRRGARPKRIARRLGLAVDDPRLCFLVYSVLLPHRTVLRADGFDLAGLAGAPREAAAAGLYPHLRSIAVYPAGTAADNALYAGIPGYAYAQLSKLLARPLLGPLRRVLARRTRARFLQTFTEGVVVPARFSLVAFDDRWCAISSHAAGGPGGGAFFAADLEKKTGGLLGYLARIPNVIIGEALLGSTVLRVSTRDEHGVLQAQTEGRMVEALYTNRAFIAGVGGVPSTNPTSLAGQSSLVLGPPLIYRNRQRRTVIDFTGVATFFEAIGKGLAGRIMHALGLSVGNLAGGGSFWSARAENQVTLREGESVELDFLDTSGHPRAVATQVSGDPYQAWRMKVLVAWGPLPLLASPTSLLMAAAQRALARLRVARSWQLQTVFIAGLAWFRHRVLRSSDADDCGVFEPPWTLPPRLSRVQRRLLRRWEAHGTGPFIDTTEQGLALGRRGRYAHNSDHSAHLMVLRERGGLLVRQVRRQADAIYEGRTLYSGWAGGWVIHEHQLRRTRPGEPPVILQEDHFFRDAQALREEAPSFFPFVGEGRTWTAADWGEDDKPDDAELGTEDAPTEEAPR